MNRIGLLFPGQGAQYVGMGRDLAENYPVARKVFEKANAVLGFDLAKICFTGPEQVLTDTENAQPAIFVVSMAALEILKESHPNLLIVAVCGLSAGEFSALVAAGSLTFESALKLVRRRGELMADAARSKPGTMTSILGLDLKNCEEVCKLAGAEIANINSPVQIVISGTPEAVNQAAELAKQRGAKRTVFLKVSGAFHSSLMKPAKDGLSEVLRKVTIEPPKGMVKFIANVSGESVTGVHEIRSGLEKQIVSPVQWVRSVQTMVALGVTKAYEVGPGAVLKGLASRIDGSLEVVSWGCRRDFKKIANNDTVDAAA